MVISVLVTASTFLSLFFFDVTLKRERFQTANDTFREWSKAKKNSDKDRR